MCEATRVHFHLSSKSRGRALCFAAASFCWLPSARDASWRQKALRELSEQAGAPLVEYVIRPMLEQAALEKELRDPLVFDLSQEDEEGSLPSVLQPAFEELPLLQQLAEWTTLMGLPLMLRKDRGTFVEHEGRVYPCSVESRLYHPVVQLVASTENRKESFSAWVGGCLQRVGPPSDREEELGPLERASLGGLLAAGTSLPQVQLPVDSDEFLPRLPVRGLARGYSTRCVFSSQSAMPPSLWTVLPEGLDEGEEEEFPFPEHHLHLPDGTSLERKALLLRDGEGVLVWCSDREEFLHVSTSHVEHHWKVGAAGSAEWRDYLRPRLLAVLWSAQ